jgi:ubiquinone/menaquinone biosynthesis C-methylase UbiE
MQHKTATLTAGGDQKPELATVKQKQHAAWSSGDYSVIGVTLQIVGETLCEAIDLRSGERVIDVAAGNGNATLAAARRFAVVTSTDYVPALLENARTRAASDGLDVSFAVADAEALDYRDGSFDVALSTFGIMFVADHERAARELLRVVRPGGRIGMTNWTPEGFIGQLFKTIGRHVPPPAGAKSPMAWGTPSWLEGTFGPNAAKIETARRHYAFRYRSPEHWLEIFGTWYGPMLKAFTALGDKAEPLKDDIRTLLVDHNRGGDGTLVIPSEYLEVVIRKR